MAAFAAYVRAYAQPGAMRAGFEIYRAFGRDAADNRRALAERGKLELPVLAVAGEASAFAALMGDMMREVAAAVETATIPRAGHWVAEENPDALAAALARFARGEWAP